MKKLFTTGFVTFCLFLQSAGQITFQKIYPALYDRSAYDVLPADDGGYILVGMTNNDIINDIDILVKKTNSTGDEISTKVYGGNRPDFPYRLLKTHDGNYFIIGYTQSFGNWDYDVYLLKITSSGDTLWTKRYGGWGNEEGRDIIATSDGNYLITGFSNSQDQNLSNQDAFLIKIDPSGNIIWQKYYGGSAHDLGNSVKECPDGGFIIMGMTKSYGAGDGDAYLVKTNAAGDFLWSKTFGGKHYDEGVYILSNSDGSFTFCVRDSSTAGRDVDIRVIKTDGSGNTIWDKSYGGKLKDSGKMIQPVADGGYIIGGISRSFGWINPNAWLVRINAAGDTLWTRHYGGWDHEHCHAVRPTADGGFIVAGHSESTNTTNEIMFLKLNQLGKLGAVAVNEILLSGYTFSVSPNPSDGIFKIDISEDKPNSLGTFQRMMLSVSNVLGQAVFSQTCNFPDRTGYTIDLNGNNPGVYFLKIQLMAAGSKDYSVTKKIVLE